MGTVYWPEGIYIFLFFSGSLFLTKQAIQIRFRLADLLRQECLSVLDLVEVFNREVFDGRLLFSWSLD